MIKVKSIKKVAKNVTICYNIIKKLVKGELGMIENLRSELVAKEMSFMELDNYMMQKGFYSVWDDGITESIKQDKNVIYTCQDIKNDVVVNEISVQIFFDITIDNGKDEAEESFYMKIEEIEEYLI